MTATTLSHVTTLAASQAAFTGAGLGALVGTSLVTSSTPNSGRPDMPAVPAGGSSRTRLGTDRLGWLDSKRDATSPCERSEPSTPRLRKQRLTIDAKTAR